MGKDAIKGTADAAFAHAVVDSSDAVDEVLWCGGVFRATTTAAQTIETDVGGDLPQKAHGFVVHDAVNLVAAHDADKDLLRGVVGLTLAFQQLCAAAMHHGAPGSKPGFDVDHGRRWRLHDPVVGGSEPKRKCRDGLAVICHTVSTPQRQRGVTGGRRISKVSRYSIPYGFIADGRSGSGSTTAPIKRTRWADDAGNIAGYSANDSHEKIPTSINTMIPM